MRSLLYLVPVHAVLLLSSFALHAQQIFKCEIEKGVFAYQQTPCSSATATAGVRSYQRVPDSPRSYGAPPRHAYQPRQSQPVQNGGGLISGGGIVGNQQRYPTREEEAELRRQQRRAQRGETATRIEQPSVVTDQHGRRYQKPPGSNIVIDERTGRPCFLVGQTLECH